MSDCGCCAGIEAQTPEPIENRPGLPAVAYRAGTHSTFFASLLAGLSTADRPQLRRLGTREPEDFTVAFLDAVATAADVLTFYQERIANEAFLRTATERRSVLELAREIGYELSPGVAAETQLAFTVESAVGAPQTADVPIGTKVQSVPGPGERPQTFETVEALDARAEWNELRPRTTEAVLPFRLQTDVYLEGVATNLSPGDAILIVGDERAGGQFSERWDMRFVDTVEPDHEHDFTRVTWRPGLGSQTPPVDPAQVNPRFFALRRKATLFGSTAPDWRTLPKEVRQRYDAGSENAPQQTEWPGLTISAIAGAADVIHLDGLHREILAGSWLVLRRRGYEELFTADEVDESARQGFGLTSKTTRVTVRGEHLVFFDDDVRDVVVYAQSEQLTMLERPIDTPVSGAAIELDRLVEPLPPGRRLVITGTPDGAAAPVLELATVKASEVAGGARTRLVLTTALAHSYRRDTVRIAANVASATHGESTAEALGSGNAGQALQHFPLRKSPLTHVYADEPPGRRSTLELRVDGLLWNEVDFLFGYGPDERVYTVRIDEDANAEAQFGDGRTGARLPTGPENVRAGYRTGLGRDGNLDPGALTLLTARPLGVRSVINPIAATGGTDPEEMVDARTNAPLTVLTLGRIVSLADYADFARAFQGVAKAHAVSVWGPGGREVLLTVAGADGAEVPDDGPVHRSLLDAIAKAGDPHVAVTVRSYEPVPFRLAATIGRDPALLPETVLAAAEAALLAHFSFAARAFGQHVPLSEVLAVLHGARGVVSVDVDALYTGTTVELQPLLQARVPRAGEDVASAEPAQLLTIDLRPDDLKVAT